MSFFFFFYFNSLLHKSWDIYQNIYNMFQVLVVLSFSFPHSNVPFYFLFFVGMSEKLIIICKEIRRKWKRRCEISTEKKHIERKNYPFASLGGGIGGEKVAQVLQTDGDARKRAKMIFRGYKGRSRWIGDARQRLWEPTAEVGVEMEEAVAVERERGLRSNPFDFGN